MRKIFLIFLIFIVLVVGFSISKSKSAKRVQNVDNFQTKQEDASGKSGVQNSSNSILAEPLENAKDRVIKKPFGIFITAQNSPVKPERFYGYHTGADFEIFPGEENKDVAVKAICQGKILSKQRVSGYGGVAVQQCMLDEEQITIIYGHLNLKSISKNAGDQWEKGEAIGKLGNGYSPETDGERKHLHLGIHKGKGINLSGYVSSKDRLDDWIDPCKYVCGN